MAFGEKATQLTAGLDSGAGSGAGWGGVDGNIAQPNCRVIAQNIINRKGVIL